MKKFLKGVLLLGGSAFAGYMGFKFYRVYREMKRVEEELPGFLEEELQELPEVFCLIQPSMGTLLTIKVKLSPEKLEGKEEIKDKILDYLKDNHPLLNKYKTRVNLVEKCVEGEDFGHGCDHSEPDEG